MFTELKGQIHGLTTQSSATQESVADLTEQVKQDIDLLQATHDKLTTLGENYGDLDAKFTETKSLVEGSLQQIRSDLDSEIKHGDCEAKCRDPVAHARDSR
ncbi:hypothetical protein ACLB2K_037426 [Fragaria x ananassa]